MSQPNKELGAWLETLGRPVVSCLALSGDVSRRRYFRISHHDGETTIAVRYPADMHSVCSRFLETSALLMQAGVHVPRVLESDCEHGFMLVEDGGTVSLYDLAQASWSEQEPFYSAALDNLERIQSLPVEEIARLNPVLDGSALSRELDLAWDRVFNREEVSGPPALRSQLRSALDRLCEELDTAPLLPCHRDYMARNLLLPEDERLVLVIDHQDLRLGPPLYDLASLLNDSLYPPPSVEHYLRAEFVADEDDLELYRRCVVQRSLKAVNTFVSFASSGDRRHLPLVSPTLARAARQLARLPEGGLFAEQIAGYWRAWTPSEDEGVTADRC